MRKLLLLLSSGLITLSLTGCSLPTSGSYHPKLYTSGSKAKGVVTMLPVFYRSGKVSEVLPWSLQTEFTQEISKRLHASDKLFLIKHTASPQLVAQFYSPNTAHIATGSLAELLPAEFVVATELLEQKTSSDMFGNDSIVASVRVRVFDIRHNQVTMIFQEILEASQPISSVNSDYHRYGWQTKNFEATPMGLMHQRLFREVVARIEGYVCANYS